MCAVFKFADHPAASALLVCLRIFAAVRVLGMRLLPCLLPHKLQLSHAKSISQNSIAVQAFTISASGTQLAWRVQLDGWEAATHVRLAADDGGVSAAAILHKCEKFLLCRSCRCRIRNIRCTS